VVDVKPGGKAETCNCGATAVIDMDTHIELGLSEETEPGQRVIVEVWFLGVHCLSTWPPLSVQ
jgi:hypothetical protein